MLPAVLLTSLVPATKELVLPSAQLLVLPLF